MSVMKIIELVTKARAEMLTSHPNEQLVCDLLTQAINESRWVLTVGEAAYILHCMSFTANEGQHNLELQKSIAEKAKAAGVLGHHTHLLQDN